MTQTGKAGQQAISSTAKNTPVRKVLEMTHFSEFSEGLQRKEHAEKVPEKQKTDPKSFDLRPECVVCGSEKDMLKTALEIVGFQKIKRFPHSVKHTVQILHGCMGHCSANPSHLRSCIAMIKRFLNHKMNSSGEGLIPPKQNVLPSS